MSGPRCRDRGSGFASLGASHRGLLSQDVPYRERRACVHARKPGKPTMYLREIDLEFDDIGGYAGQTVQQNPQVQSGCTDFANDYGIRNPLEVGVQLRALINRGDFLTLEHRNGKFVTRLLDVDTRKRTFTFERAALVEQDAAVLEISTCKFHASPEGIRVEFATAMPWRKEFDGRPAFEAPFPEVFHFVQRRASFRVNAPVADGCTCKGRFSGGQAFTLRLHDISLGGVGLRTSGEQAEKFVVGQEMYVELDLRRRGKLYVDLVIVRVRLVELPHGGRCCHVGLRFKSLPGMTENTLQRYIAQLEMERRSVASQ